MTLAKPARLLLALGCVLLSVMLPATAQAASPTPNPNTVATTPSTPGTTPVPTTVTLQKGIVKPGEIIQVSGAGWPANITLQANVCGQNAIEGASDCNQEAAGGTVTSATGTFILSLPIERPPTPCPCVVHVVGPDSATTISQPIEIVGQGSAPLNLTSTTRQLTATSKITGGGPLTSWFGGAAKRTYVLTVTNTGSSTISNPVVTITFGKGQAPTTVIGRPQIGTVNPGQTLSYRVPIKIAAPAFGEYNISAQFNDLDKPLTTTASTSCYPWGLIVIGWLLLQPVILGLYKRRPVFEDGPESDPFAPRLPSLNDPFPAAASIAGFEDPLFAGVPMAAVAGAAAAGVVVGAASHTPAGAYAGVFAHQPSPLVPDYRPVFGVTDLRGYLDPNATLNQPTIAPRIVLGGIVPNGLPPAPADVPLNGSNGAEPAE